MGGILTFEIVYELVRNEKKSDELQKIEQDTYDNCIDYIKNKIAIFKADSVSMSETEKESSKKEINNIRRLIKELMEKREHKIIELAFVRSHAQKKPPLSTYNLIGVERDLLDKAESLFSKYKDEVILPVVNAKSVEPSEQQSKKTTELVRILHAIPKFVDQDLVIYGPFMEGDLVNLPKEIADLIVQKGRGEQVKPS